MDAEIVVPVVREIAHNMRLTIRCRSCHVAGSRLSVLRPEFAGAGEVRGGSPGSSETGFMCVLFGVSGTGPIWTLTP